jgi:proteasome lid subunit RPN8/RPN11
VEIMAALPAVSGSHGPIHFTFNADSWTQLQRDRTERYPKLDMVGWFHTHPGLGVFYSGDDVVVHSAAFTLPWHVGLVVDPVNNEASFFGWHKGQLAPSAGFYELLDTPESVVDWRMVRTSVWQETYEEHLAGEQGLEPYSRSETANWQPKQQNWGLIAGALGLLLSFFLLVGWVVPLTRQVNQLEALTLTLADQTLTENVAACPDPNLRILSPAMGDVVRVGSEVDVVGTAVHAEAYRYRVEVRPEGADLWSLAGDKRTDTDLGTIATWNTTPHQPAVYEMRLTAVDRNNIRLAHTEMCLIEIVLVP